MTAAGGRRVVIAGGGTGGHLYPGLAVARALTVRERDLRVTFAGTRAGIEARVIPREGYEIDFIRSAGLKGKSMGARLRGAALLGPSVVDAWRLVARRAPALVVGVGGYSSGPVVLVAALRGIPTLVLEQNALPGATNRLLARVVRAAAVTYESSLPFFRGKGFVTGNPVRASFFAGSAPGRTAGGPGSVLIFGGSQGAHAINMAMVEAAGRLQPHGGIAIVHQTGERDRDEVRRAYAEAGVAARVEPFLYAMDEEMARADLVVCRAGATTLAELAAAGRPAVLVPFPHATDDHQRRNAEVLARAGAAVLVDQRELSGAGLAEQVLALLADPDRLGRMGAAMRAFARPDAADRIADKAFELMRA